MATPTGTTDKISKYVRSDLEKMLATLPRQGSDVILPPPKAVAPGWDERRHADESLQPSFPLPADPEPGRYYPLAPTPVITETQPIVRKEDILLTPPISKDVIIMPPSMAEKPSLLLPILVAGAILLMQ